MMGPDFADEAVKALLFLVVMVALVALLVGVVIGVWLL